MSIDVIFFFFFQAEDGIRDYKVTGVQTCALPILFSSWQFADRLEPYLAALEGAPDLRKDRKSTRLNSSHLVISYAVFCLKKKKTKSQPTLPLYKPKLYTYTHPVRTYDNINLHCHH